MTRGNWPNIKLISLSISLFYPNNIEPEGIKKLANCEFNKLEKIELSKCVFIESLAC